LSEHSKVGLPCNESKSTLYQFYQTWNQNFWTCGQKIEANYWGNGGIYYSTVQSYSEHFENDPKIPKQYKFACILKFKATFPVLALK
jgi:hypothetical protein